MFTIKHVEDNHEGVWQVRELTFTPSTKTLTGFGCPGPDEGGRKDGVISFGSGTAYVMNESGKTVSVYNLS